jgi:hypothetical protein
MELTTIGAKEDSMRAAVIAAVAILVVPSAFAQSWNLLDNPHFDTGVLHWSEASQAIITWDPSVDAFGDPDSGSVLIVQITGDIDAAVAVADCVSITPNTEYRFGGRIYVQGAQPGTPRVLVGLALYDGPGCTGSALSGPSTSNLVTTDQWMMKESSWITQPEAVSARFRVNIFNSTTDTFEVHGDTMFVIDNTRLFEDGFEDGNTGQWSSTLPM